MEDRTLIKSKLAKEVGFNLRYKSYTRKAERAKSFYRKGGGYAFDISLFGDIISKGTNMIIINEVDTGSVFVSLVEDWFRYGQIDSNKFGKQICLPERLMTSV